MSTGEATEDDGDYYGDCIVEAARLCALAEGGQILATDAVRVMAGRHRPAEMTPVGELELKGIPEPVAAVEVQWAPAEADEAFPLPARLSAASTAGVFAFAGRLEEVARLDEIRKDAEAGGLQIALISGEPGIGKTSLAAEAARAVPTTRATRCSSARARRPSVRRTNHGSPRSPISSRMRPSMSWPACAPFIPRRCGPFSRRCAIGSRSAKRSTPIPTPSATCCSRLSSSSSLAPRRTRR